MLTFVPNVDIIHPLTTEGNIQMAKTLNEIDWNDWEGQAVLHMKAAETRRLNELDKDKYSYRIGKAAVEHGGFPEAAVNMLMLTAYRKGRAEVTEMAANQREAIIDDVMDAIREAVGRG